MTEKELIAKIQELRQIRPRNSWVILTKNQILGTSTELSARGEKSQFSFIGFLRELQRGEKFVFQHKPAFAFITTLLVLIGVFGFAQNSVPGDFLFSFKKIAEQSQTIFISEKEQPKHNLETVNKRLDDLTKIAQANQSQKLAPAITEYQQTVSKAAESLSKADPKNDSQNLKELVAEVKKIEEKTFLIKSLGIEGIGENQEWDNALAQIVEREIKDLEETTLTEEQQEALIEIQKDYEAGNYSQALEKILVLTNN